MKETSKLESIRDDLEASAVIVDDFSDQSDVFYDGRKGKIFNRHTLFVAPKDPYRLGGFKTFAESLLSERKDVYRWDTENNALHAYEKNEDGSYETIAVHMFPGESVALWKAGRVREQ